MHTCTMSRVQRDYRSIWNRGVRFQLSSYQAAVNSPDPSAKLSISSVKQRADFHTVGGSELSKANSVRRSAESIRH
jgi:hypothetical protein